MSLRTALLSGLLLSFISGVSWAHDFWIHADRLEVPVGTPLRFDLRVGHPLEFESVVRSKELLDSFCLIDSLGERQVLGREGRAPAGLSRARVAGPLLVAYAGKAQALELPAEKFHSYLREEGLDQVLAWREAHGESELPGRENYSRCAKTLLHVTASPAEEEDQREDAPEREHKATPDVSGTSADVSQNDCGLTLEIFPCAQLLREASSGTAAPVRQLSSFELLFEGEPIEGVLVRALHLYRPQLGQEARTDKKGRVQFELNEGGPWLLRAVHMRRSVLEEVDWESYWASLVLELPAVESSASVSK